MVFWFFGYPGIGKDFCAEKLSKLAKIPHVDADDFLTDLDKNKLTSGTFGDEDRIKKLTRIIIYMKSLKYPNLTIGDSLPTETARKFVLESLGENVVLILVRSDPKIHQERIRERRGHFFREEYLDSWIKKPWQEVKVDHLDLENVKGKLEEQLLRIYNQFITSKK